MLLIVTIGLEMIYQLTVAPWSSCLPNFFISRGNCVLVGSLDLPLHSLSSLALYIAGYSEQQQQLLEEDGLDYRQFIEVLRCVLRLAGLEGSQVALVMEVN